MSPPNDADMSERPLGSGAMDPLERLGWTAYFSEQTDADTLAATPPVRITSVHRSGLQALGATTQVKLPPRKDVTVGDWLLYDAQHPQDSTLLERTSLIKRRSPGKDRYEQLIAANIDTAFIVTSCNADFNIARLERYVALAFDANVTPVILLTKPDLCADTAPFVTEALSISELVEVAAVNAKSDTAAALLATWCRPGKTVAFLGSSGVGKSTLTNALIGSAQIETQDIREVDARGRHTTTRRELHFVPNGCSVLDTPGMRELQLTDAAAGLDDLFADLRALAQTCKFRDCAHASEPGCAINAAIKRGNIERARFERWQKLVTEDTFNTASLSDLKRREKSLHKTIKAVQKRNHK